MAGVPTNRFIQVKSPFNALSYNDIIGDVSQNALIFVRSEKDKTSHPLPDQVRKSDGNMGYLISYTGNDNLETADTHGYLAYGPTIDFDFSGMSIKSASELRAAWPEMSDEDKLQAAELMYPGNAETATQLLNKALGVTEPAEGVQEENNILDPLRGAAAELFGKPEVSSIPPEETALLQAMEKYKDDPAGLKDWLRKEGDLRYWLMTDGNYLADMVKSRIKGKPKTESKDELCKECGKPSWKTLDEEKQKGVDGKVCWKGYRRMGTKKKNGKTVDNCVKVD
jgi:hypothetical protein